MLHNPLFEEQFRLHFQSRTVLRLLRTYVVLLAIMLIISWPGNPLSHYLKFDTKPGTFQFIFLMLFLFGFILTILPVSTQDQGIYSLTEWITYTPIGIAPAYLGRFLFSLFYVVFLLLLSLPLVVIGATVSGFPPVRVLSVCVVFIVFCMFFRTLILALLLLMDRRPLLRAFCFGLALLFFLFLCIRVAPALHPVLIIQGILSGSRQIELLNFRKPFSWTGGVLFYSVATGINIMGSIAFMSIVKRRSGRRQ